MSFLVSSGTFDCPGSTGSQAITEVGFKPKAVMLFATANTADGNSIHYGIAIGFATASAQEAGIYSADTDGVATTANRRGTSNAEAITLDDGSGFAILLADFTSLDADGFTLNWTIVTSGVDIHYIAWGGSDITNIKAGTYSMAAATGNQAVTGIGFQGDFGFFLHSNLTSDVTASSTLSLGIGAAKSSSAQWAQNWFCVNGVSPSVTRGTQITDSCITLNTQFGVLYRGTFVSWDTDGFTINNTTVDGEADRVHYLVFKGGQYKVGSLDQPTSTGNQSISSVGFRSSGVFFSSYNLAANATQQSHARTSFGIGVASSNRRAIWAGSSDNVATTVCDQATDTTKALKLMTEGTPAVNAEADYVSNDSDGFTINWTTADATARQIVYVAFGAKGFTRLDNHLRPRAFAPGLAR